MKKRLFGIALALCMALALLPTAAFAEGSGEIELTKAYLDEHKQYDSLGDWHYHLETGTYKLAENIEITTKTWIDISNGASVSLDLNGFTLSNTGYGTTVFPVENSASFSLNDSSAAQSGAIVSKGSSIDVCGAGASVVMNGGTVSSVETSAAPVSFVLNGGVITGDVVSGSGDSNNIFYANGGEVRGNVEFMGKIAVSEGVTSTTLVLGKIAYGGNGIDDQLAVAVTFDSNGGSAVDAWTGLRGQKVPEPENSTKEGFEFENWYNGDKKWSFYAPVTANMTLTAHWLKSEAPNIIGLENGATYCGAKTFTVTDNVGVTEVTVNGKAIQPVDENGTYTLTPAEGEQTIAASDAAGNSYELKVTVNSDHTYEWQSENGQYWQKCTGCNTETEKKAIPALTIDAPDTVCRTQDTELSFDLPEGCTNPEFGYEFTNVGSGDSATVENGVCRGTVEAEWYDETEDSFKLTVYATTADGYSISASKTITIQNEHTGGKADCHTKAVCAVCGEAYGEFDAANHTGGTEVRGAKEATCTTDGYTGDTYCKGCGVKWESGTVLSQRHPMLTKVEEKAATAEQTGTKAHWHCATCNGDFADAAGTQKVTAAELTIPKLTVEKKDDKTTEPKKDDKTTEPKKDDKKAEAKKDDGKKTSPKTADTAAPVLALAMLAAAGAGLAVTKRKGK